MLAVSSAVPFTLFGLADPYRIVLDLPDIDWRATQPAFESTVGVVAGMRYGRFRPDTGRVVLDRTMPTVVLLAETLPQQHRQTFDMGRSLQGARRLLTDRGFMGLTFLGGFGMASFFVFIASGPFVYTQAFGLSPTQFSLAFAVNAIGFFGASQLAAGLGLRFGAQTVVQRATFGFAVATAGLLGLGLAGYASLPVVVAGLFLANACLGLVIPTVMVLAREDHGKYAS